MAPFVTAAIISFTVTGYFTFSMGGLIDCSSNNEERDKSIVYFPDSKLTLGSTAQFSTVRILCPEVFGIMLSDCTLYFGKAMQFNALIVSILLE